MSKPILPVILSCSGESLNDNEKKIFNQNNPLGINLFSRNIKNLSQLQELVSSIKNTIERDDVLIAIDQEGGRVRRLIGTEFHNTASAINIGQLPSNQALRCAYLHAQITSYDLHKAGINTNYAPVLDAIYSSTTSALKSRCLSDNPKIISKLAQQKLDTYLQNGIIPCIKHLPGHGRAVTDPHLSLPVISATLKELETDFFPFCQLNYSPLGMSAHIVISALDDQHPATQSPKVINDIIRGYIGFDGLLISDAIDMHALKGSISERTLNSLNAGCDAICYAGGKIDDIYNIISSCQPMSDKSLERFAKTKKIKYNQPNFDNIETLYQEYLSMLSTIPPYQEDYDATEVLNIMNNH